MFHTCDPWGNLNNKVKIPTPCAGENLSVVVGGSNRITSSGYGYDIAGNMTTDGTELVSLHYDPENRADTATKAGITTSYVYDADGNRVEKLSPPPPATPTTGTLYWYMTPGIIGESDLAGTMKSEYVFFNGERVARRDFPAASVAYYFSDHLKTASVVTDSAGNIKSDSDFYPWGGELQFVNADSNHYKFTGKERDSETQLDYFGARYYSNGLGRFITPDWAAKPAAVPYAEFADPQSLNLYTYVRNTPETRLDVDGHDYICIECVYQSVKNWVNGPSHSSTKSFEKSAKESTTTTGALTTTGKLGTRGYSKTTSTSASGASISAEAHASTASAIIKAGNVSTTELKGVSGEVSGNAKLSLNAQQGKGVALGGSAHADAFSATETLKLGPVTVTATGDVGFGAQLTFSATQDKGVEFSAGLTDVVGGSVKFSIAGAGQKATAGASASADKDGKVKTDIQKPKVEHQ